MYVPILLIPVVVLNSAAAHPESARRFRRAARRRASISYVIERTRRPHRPAQWCGSVRDPQPGTAGTVRRQVDRSAGFGFLIVSRSSPSPVTCAAMMPRLDRRPKAGCGYICVVRVDWLRITLPVASLCGPSTCCHGGAFILPQMQWEE